VIDYKKPLIKLTRDSIILKNLKRSTDSLFLTLGADSVIRTRGLSTLGFITGITADNGLTANTATNVQLCGSLIQNTTIDVSTFDYKNIGTRAATYILDVENSNTTSGYGIQGYSFGNGFLNSAGINGSGFGTFGIGVKSFGNYAGVYAQGGLYGVFATGASSAGIASNVSGGVIGVFSTTQSGVAIVGNVADGTT